MSTPPPDFNAFEFMSGVFDSAWADVKNILGERPLDPHVVQLAMFYRLATAVYVGERDPARLKLVALKGIEGERPVLPDEALT